MEKQAKHFYEFDTFRVDVEERQLLQNGKPVQLTPKVFDILLALVENCDHTLGKDELMQRIWSDSFVEEGNLNRNVSTLRKVLGDNSHEPRFIRTAPKRGYRFVGEVQEIWEEEVENRTRFHLKVSEEVYKEEGEKERRGERETFRRVAVGGLVLLLIAVAVSAFLWNRAAKNEARALMKGTENGEAFELYQKGRALWETRSGENLHQATILLEQALQKDGNFALAHAALADAYAFDYTNWKKAEPAAREAIRLDANLGEPHATIGFVKMFWEWNLIEAESEFKESIRKNPNYATAHQWYSILLSAIDRNNAAHAEMSRALELAPASTAVNTDFCRTLYFLRQFDEAAAQCQKTLAMDDKSYNASRYLTEIYFSNGMTDAAVAQHFRTEDIAEIKMPPTSNEKLRTAYKNGGINAFWQARIEFLSRSSLNYQLAQTYARLGDKEKAFDALQKAYEKHDVEFLLFFADPAFDNLRDDQRFKNFIALLYPTNE